MARVSFWGILLATLILVGLGIAMVTSTSAFTLQADPDNPYGNIFDHLMWGGIGLVALALGMTVRYQKWRDWLPALLAITVVLLGCCFFEFLGGREHNGERRWVEIGIPGVLSKELQPSEGAKFVVVLLLAWWFSREQMAGKAASFWKGFALPLIGAGALASLVLFEVDMGTTAVILASVVCLMFLAGVRPLYLFAMICLAALAFALILQHLEQDKLVRIYAWQDPYAYRAKEGYQQWVGLKALMSGGWFGCGLGNSVIKVHELPFAHTDFVAAILGDELGLLGTGGAMLCFLVIAIGGLQISLHAPDIFGKLLGCGIVCTLTLQALFNFAVVTALLPNKGLPLPFISYGGSNLVTSLFFIGVLGNLYRQGKGYDGQRTDWVTRKRFAVRW